MVLSQQGPRLPISDAKPIGAAAGAGHLGAAAELLLHRAVEDYARGSSSLSDCVAGLVQLVGAEHVSRSLQHLAVGQPLS